MKSLVSTLLQRSTLMVTSFILAISSLSAAMPLFLSQTANAVAAYAITSTTTPAVTYTDIQTAVDATAPGDTIEIGAGTYNLLSQLNINKPLSIIGTSSVIVKSNNAAWSTVNGSKHLVSITAGTSVNPVSISNITFDANGQSYGMNTYSNAYGVLNNVTIMNSKGAGLTVNGSTIEATNLDTSGNSWGAVNVDPGSGVTTPSVFTLNSGNLAESNQIWSDGSHVTGSATVTVNAPGYTLYHISGLSSFRGWKTASPAPTNLSFTQGSNTLSCGAITGTSGIYSTHLNWTIPAGETSTGWKVTPTYPSGSHGTTYSWNTGTDVWVGANIGQGYGAAPHNQGLYSYSVQYKDAFGVWSQPAVCGLVYDSVAPVVTVTPVAGSTLSGTVTFNITVTDDNLNPSMPNTWVYLYNTNSPYKQKGASVNLSSGHGTFTVDTTLLNDGNTSLDVGKLYDAAGNASGVGDTYFRNYTIDNTIPSAQITSPTNGQFVKGNTLTIKGSANDSNNFNYYYCYVTLPGSSEVGVRGADCNTTWHSVTNDVLGTVNISGLADGNYEAHLVAYDKAGNHSDLNYFVPFTLDNSAPQVDTITLNSVSVTSPRATNCGPTDFNLVRGDVDLSAMIDDGTGAGTDSASYRILKVTNSGCTMSNPAHDYGGGVFGYQSNTVNMIHSGNNWTTPSGSVLDTKALGLNGKYTIALTTKDTLGNTTIQYIDLDIDNTKPSISASLSDTLINSTDANPILTVNANDSGSGVAYTQYSIMDSTMTKILGWFTIPGSTTDTVDVSSLGDGDYTVRARAFDNAGNKKSGADVAFTIDRTAPAVTINTPSAITVGTPTTTITGTNDNLNNIITVSIGGGTPITVPSVDVTNTAWSLVVDTSALGVGTHSITVLASDLAGNVSDGTAASANADLAVNAVPAVQPQVNSIQSPATPGNTGTSGGTGTQTVTPGEVLGDQTTNNDAAKTGDSNANPSASILGDATSNPMNLFGLAWYWWLAILAAIIAAWWIIAAALRRRDNQNV